MVLVEEELALVVCVETGVCTLVELESALALPPTPKLKKANMIDDAITDHLYLNFQFMLIPPDLKIVVPYMYHDKLFSNLFQGGYPFLVSYQYFTGV
ncbi:hypothetical protein HMPREF9103_02167 [Lentilactobacillus parafarraginis F0439]|uniref:Uncharacterized protein n=1 Tax=Lentilactobacillus parafarraginis F0439 TaxID=797515 RepID=G9ZR09_9LACO|nr:hypothetical protein HMPREF9103_02167 [Lentilactobacillus parafarraginis F0439]